MRKASIQARIRCYPTVAANSGHPMLVEHEYDRGGSLAYIAAWDVHRARLFGCLEPSAGIESFDRLVSQVPRASVAMAPIRRRRSSDDMFHLLLPGGVLFVGHGADLTNDVASRVVSSSAEPASYMRQGR
jgi:hypothetical protein